MMPGHDDEMHEEIPEGFKCICRGSTMMLVPDPPQKSRIEVLEDRLAQLTGQVDGGGEAAE